MWLRIYLLEKLRQRHCLFLNSRTLPTRHACTSGCLPTVAISCPFVVFHVGTLWGTAIDLPMTFALPSGISARASRLLSGILIKTYYVTATILCPGNTCIVSFQKKENTFRVKFYFKKLPWQLKVRFFSGKVLVMFFFLWLFIVAVKRW